MSQATLPAPDIETSSDLYKRRFAGKTGEWFLYIQANCLLSMLTPWNKASILDIGGGHGQYTDLLVQKGYDVTIIGSSQEADGQVRDLIAGNSCRYLVGDLVDLPFADKTFDIVIGMRLLTHLKDWHRLVSEAARVAKNSIIVDYPVLHSFNYLYPILFKLKRNLEGKTTRPFHVFDEHEVLQAFHHVGFTPTSRYGQYFLPMVVHRMLHAKPLSMLIEKCCHSTGLTDRFGSPVITRLEPENLHNNTFQ